MLLRNVDLVSKVNTMITLWLRSCISLTVGADLLKLMVIFKKKKTICSQTLSLPASLPEAGLMLVYHTKTGCWHHVSANLLICRLKVVGDTETITKRGIQNPSQTEPATSQGLCDSLHEPAACLFDDFVKRADPWPFNSWWVTDATLKDGASPHMHLCQQQLTFKGCTKPLFVLYATICRRVLTDVV